jgi:hypothetical protein
MRISRRSCVRIAVVAFLSLAPALTLEAQDQSLEATHSADMATKPTCDEINLKSDNGIALTSAEYDLLTYCVTKQRSGQILVTPEGTLTYQEPKIGADSQNWQDMLELLETERLES